MLQLHSRALSGFVAGFLAFIGARSLVRLIALVFVHPFPTAFLLDAIIGSVALVLGIALLFRASARNILFTRIYLAVNLLGQVLMLVIAVCFHSHAWLPTWSSGVTTVFMLLCFYFTFQIREDALRDSTVTP